MENITQLSIDEVAMVSAGIDSGQGGFGAGLLGVALGIVAVSPIGALSIAAVTVVSFTGGFLVSNSIVNDGDISWIQ